MHASVDSLQASVSDSYEALTRRFDQERIRIHEAQGFACVQRETSDVRQQPSLQVLVHIKPAATGILNQDAANILH
jgi:hypothetical protein